MSRTCMDQIGFHHFFQRGAKGGDERGRQVRDETNRIGEDRPAAATELQLAHGRIERREDLIDSDDAGARQAIEEGRFAGIRVTDDGDQRIRNAATPGAVQFARADDNLELLADRVDAILKDAPVHLDLHFAGTTQKAVTAALALEVGPGAHQPALLVRLMRVPPAGAFAGSRPAPEVFEDEDGSGEHLGLQARSRLRCWWGDTGVFDMTSAARARRSAL